MDNDGVVLTGRIIKIRRGKKAAFYGEIGSFPIEHDSIEDLGLGVYEATIHAVGVTKKKGAVLMSLGSAPIVGACVVARPG